MQEKAPYKVLGQYRCIKKLSDNYIATSYLVEERNSNQLFVLKEQHLGVQAASNTLVRTRACIMARLSHPNIVRMISFGTENTVEYFISQYASRGSIRQKFLGSSRITASTLVDYANQVASALQYAHTMHITHSYLKPENILFDVEVEESVLLSDFGPTENFYLSYDQNSHIPLTAFYYVAPEQIRGNAQPSSDQYALGAILYEKLSTHPPFSGSAKEILAQHLYSKPPSLRKFVPSISSYVDEVIMTALEKNPQNRFVSIAAFAKAFEQASHF